MIDDRQRGETLDVLQKEKKSIEARIPTQLCRIIQAKAKIEGEVYGNGGFVDRFVRVNNNMKTQADENWDQKFQLLARFYGRNSLST